MGVSSLSRFLPSAYLKIQQRKWPRRSIAISLAGFVVPGSDKVKILFLAANPVDVVTRLRIDKEIREISQKIRSGPLGDQLQLESAWAVRAGDLQELLMRHQPDIVHFSGHSSPSGGIMLEDECGNREVVNIEALADLFRILKGKIRVVVLNACSAKDQAQALATAIDFTIAMNAAIKDKDATIFAAHFYQSLAFGYSVRDSFNLAVNQLKLVGDVAHVPVLLERKGRSSARSRIVKPARVAVAGEVVGPTLIPEENSNITIGGQVMRGGAGEEQEGKRSPFASLPWLFASVAISLTADVLRRFMADGWPDIAALIVQSVFVLLAIVAAAVTIITLVLPANPLVVKAAGLGAFNAPRKVQRAVILTGIALVIALGLWLSLPAFARYYNERGVRFQYREQSDLTRARESYQQAVRLQPRYAQAHYNLAIVLEHMQLESAIEEYRLAISYGSRIYPAYNNLARLYLLRGKDDDYESALNLLSQAGDLAPQDENVQYSLNKNLGWANYALKHYAMSELYLRKAIALSSQESGAAAHCLLAYVLKEQGKAGVADECFDCVSLAPGEKDVEARWVSDAQECLKKEGGK
jgi:tetratricopeptide (TPR) repeat protein